MFFVCLSPLKTHGFYLEHQNRHLPHSLSSWTIGLSSAAVAAAAAGVVGVGGRAACHRRQCLSSQVGFGLSLIWGKKSLRALYPRYHDTSPKFNSFLKEINAILNFFTPTKDFHLDDKHFLFYFHRLRKSNKLCQKWSNINIFFSRWQQISWAHRFLKHLSTGAQ